MSFWIVPRSTRARDALLFGDGDVKTEQNRRRRVDRHRSGDLVERQPLEQQAHVLDGVDGHARRARPRLGARVVGIAPHLRRQIERHREARLALRQQIVVAAVRFRGGAEPGVLAHRPETRAVHVGLRSAREGGLAGKTEVSQRIEARRFEIVGAVDVGGIVAPRVKAGLGARRGGRLAGSALFARAR